MSAYSSLSMAPPIGITRSSLFFRAGVLFAGIGIMCLAVWVSPRMHACRAPAQIDHVVDPNEARIDVTPPGSVAVAQVQVRRGLDERERLGPERCEEYARVGLQVTATDNRTSTTQMGYRLELASGALPDGLVLPETPVKARGGWIWLGWHQDGSSQVESFKFEVKVTPVDLAGNVGAPVRAPVASSGATQRSSSPTSVSPVMVRQDRGGRAL